VQARLQSQRRAVSLQLGEYTATSSCPTQTSCTEESSWDVGMLGYWDAGLLGRWDIGVLACWNVGVLECESVGILGC